MSTAIKGLRLLTELYEKTIEHTKRKVLHLRGVPPRCAKFVTLAYCIWHDDGAGGHNIANVMNHSWIGQCTVQTSLGQRVGNHPPWVSTPFPTSSLPPGLRRSCSPTASSTHLLRPRGLLATGSAHRPRPTYRSPRW